ncbi:MAG: SprB repeat-containing protein, partial [Phaeodactylibacter sp.]|nr:SprB repeat-containing protein [Phaeodactylibacter sp.]
IDGVTLDIDDVSGCGVQDGAIQLSLQGGNPPYEIAWTGATTGTLNVVSSSATIENLPQGGYFLTVTDGSVDACPFYIPLTVVNGPNADVSISSIDSVSCYGAADGCIQLEINDPLATISWNTGATGAEICDLPAGNYTATVSNGACENVIGPLSVAAPDSLIIKVAAIEDAACFGTFTGAISILTVGGTPPYSYAWSNGLTEASISGLAAGDYFVTVLDYNGCTAQAGPIPVAGVPPLEVMVLRQEISCFGNSDGQIQLNASGGEPPYAYAWNTGSNLPELTDLGPGSYSVTLTDFNGCLWSTSIELEEPPALQAILLNQLDATCTGLPDGELEVAGLGGTMPYQYAWSSGETDSLAENLLTGWYSLTITDANLCSYVLDSLRVGGAPEVLVNAEIVPASCLGGDDGALALNPVSGALPLEYEWSTGATSQVLTGLEAGSYTVTLTDAIGCMNTQNFIVAADQPINYSSSGIPPNCFGEDNGLIFLTGLNGAPPLNYQWNTGAGTNDLEDLTAGAYVCTITDATGCYLITDTIFLVDPPEIQITLEAIDSISCAGDMNAGIDVTVSGGLPPYLYTWNNDLTEVDIQGLGPGNYTLTVEDALNCAINGPIIAIPEPAPLVVTSMEIDSPIDCADNILDSIQLQISGGTLPYGVLWSNGDTTTYLTGAGSGEFDVSVTDAAGCQVTLVDIKIPNPAPVLELRLDSTALYPDDCANLPDAGDLRVLIEGGYPPYQYNWSHGVQNQTSEDTLEVNGLEEGFYNVTVTDDVGCTTVLSDMEILLPDPLNAFIQPGGIVDVLCKYGSTGSIQLNVVGGFPDYSYIWQTQLGATVSTLEDPLGLLAGQYRAIVRDQFGCEVATPFVTVDQPDSLLNVEYDIVDIFCFGQQTGSISTEIAGGAAPYDIHWSTGSTQVQITNLPAGLYSLTVSDDNNCVMLLDSLEVEGPDAPVMLESTQVGQVSCYDGHDGFIDLTVSGGTPGYSYFWSNGAFSQDLFNLPEGPYDCLIIDEKGCTLQTQI